MVSAVKNLLREKRLLLTAVGVFVVFTLFTAPLFSMIAFTRGGEFIQSSVARDNSYYFIQQASAQEGEGDITGGESSEVDEPSPPEQEEPPPPDECPAGTHPGTGTATFGQCIPDEPTPSPEPSQQTPPPSSTPPVGASRELEPEPDVPPTCEPGYYWNGRECVSPPQCNEDEYWDSTTERCEKKPRCLGSEIWDEAAGLCKQIPPGRGELDGSNIFDILAVGDSVMWGQGLREEEKFYSLIGNEIRSYIKEKTSKDIPVVVHVGAAHSGAVIGARNDNEAVTKLPGEIPSSIPTIIKQVENYRPTLNKIDLILVDGCINDVNFRTIVDLDLYYYDEFEAILEKHCYQDMVSLLDKIKSAINSWGNSFRSVGAYYDTSQVKIVVTGYFKVISEGPEGTDMSKIHQKIKDTYSIQDSKQHILSKRWEHFVSSSNKFLQNAVNKANEGQKHPIFFFVTPDFKDLNALFASNPFLWGASEKTIKVCLPAPKSWIRWGIFLLLPFPITLGYALVGNKICLTESVPDPVDNVKDSRRIACDQEYGGPISNDEYFYSASTIPGLRKDLETREKLQKKIEDLYGCYLASLAHPNTAGAQAYAQAVKSLLPDIGLPLWITSYLPPTLDTTTPDTDTTVIPDRHTTPAP